MTVPEVPEVAATRRGDHPDWCTNYVEDHDLHTGHLGDLAAQGGDVILDLWQAVGAKPFVEMTSGRGRLDLASMTLFLSPRQADRLGRRLIEAAAILMEKDR
jgi:hypothetical protein